MKCTLIRQQLLQKLTMTVEGIYIGEFSTGRNNNTNTRIRTFTVQIGNRDISASINLHSYETFDPIFVPGPIPTRIARAGILRCVSEQEGIETWDINNLRINEAGLFRRNVSSITFGVLGINTIASAQYTILYWS